MRERNLQVGDYREDLHATHEGAALPTGSRVAALRKPPTAQRGLQRQLPVAACRDSQDTREERRHAWW